MSRSPANDGPAGPPANGRTAFDDQLRMIPEVANHIANLPGDFADTAAAYAAWRHDVFRHLIENGPKNLQISAENGHVLHDLHKAEGGAVVVLAHTGCWFAVPFAVHALGIPFTFLMETADDRLLEQYEAIDLKPLQAAGGVTLVLNDGRSIRIPGASAMQQAQEALADGLTVGFFGDTPRDSGQEVQILGLSRRLINHYALLCVQLERSLVALRQWTEDDTLRIRFNVLTPPPQMARKTSRARYLVEAFAELLDADLRARPHQYAYFPHGLFGDLAQRNP